MEKLHPVHRHQAADSSHPKTKPSSKQLRDITTWDPESKAQRSHILGSRRLHRQLTPRDSKAPKLQKMHIPAYRHTHPRSFGLWLAKSTQIKYPITHDPGQWLREIKCTQNSICDVIRSHTRTSDPILRSFISPASWGTVAGFPHETYSVLTRKHKEAPGPMPSTEKIL